MWASLLYTASCPLWAKASLGSLIKWENWNNGQVLGRPAVTFVDIHHLPGSRIPLSNLIHINPEGIHSLLCPVGTKAKPLLRSNAVFEFHLKVKAFITYLGWFISSLTPPCLLTAVVYLLAIKKIQGPYSNTQDPDSRCTSHLPVAFISCYLTSLFRDFIIFKLFIFFLWLSIPLLSS